jgi:hypothetical protein
MQLDPLIRHQFFNQYEPDFTGDHWNLIEDKSNKFNNLHRHKRSCWMLLGLDA